MVLTVPSILTVTFADANYVEVAIPQNCSSISVQADPDNAALIYVALSNTATTAVYPLSASNSLNLNFTNDHPYKLYVKGTAAQKFNYFIS